MTNKSTEVNNRIRHLTFDDTFIIVFKYSLTDEEKIGVERAIGYANASVIHGENATYNWTCDDLALEVYIYTTKGSGNADDYFETLEDYFNVGSPLRIRRPHTGTRAVNPAPGLLNAMQYVFTDLSEDGLSVLDVHSRFEQWRSTHAPKSLEFEIVDIEMPKFTTVKRIFTIEVEVPENATEITVKIKL